MLAANAGTQHAPARAGRTLRPRPTNQARYWHPTRMIAFANAFILILFAGFAWIGLAAVVQNRSNRRHAEEHRSTNAAA